MVEDEWSKMPPSKEWLYATAEFNGDHKAECEHVLGWVKGEEQCTGSMCEHGRDLASEWMTRCKGLVEGPAFGEVSTLRDQLAARAAGKPTECGKSFEDIVRDGCGEDKTCEVTGQRWATRCGKSDGTPLALRILSRVVERRVESGTIVKLDARPCEELRGELVEAAKCKDRFACADLAPKVETYHLRCDTDDDRPTIATAALELTVLVGGNKSSEPILVKQGSPGVKPDELPVALGDGSGGIISICDERATDTTRYLNARKACQGGRLVVARAFQTGKGVEVRAGSLDFPDDATFSARYPTIVSAHELEARDKEAAILLGAELRKAEELGRTSAGAAEAGRIVAKAVIANALSIKRSPAVRAVIAEHDAGLGPAFRELAKTKAAGARAKMSAIEQAGVAERGLTKVFADLSPEGAFQLGASTHAFTLETAAIFPRAQEDYLRAWKSVRPRKVDSRTGKSEKAKGQAAAQSCGASIKRLTESKKALVSCDFGLERCDGGKRAELLKSVDEARVAVEGSFRELEMIRTGLPEESANLARSSEAAGCREPWW